jgi:MFS family permease
VIRLTDFSKALSSQFISYINTLLMPSTLLSYIVADLPPDTSYAWITISWNVCASVLVTVGGRLSDIFGRRWFLIIATVIALIGAVVGATGKTVNQM